MSYLLVSTDIGDNDRTYPAKLILQYISLAMQEGHRRGQVSATYLSGEGVGGWPRYTMPTQPNVKPGEDTTNLCGRNN